MDNVISLAREAGFFGLEDRKTVGPWERFYTLARADLLADNSHLLADNSHLQGEVISTRSENMRMRDALSQLEIYAEESNNACYGTVSANLVLDIVRAALGETK